MTELKYEKYITTDIVKENKWGGEGIGLSRVPDDVTPLGTRMTLAITVVRQPYMFHEATHKHIFTEYFFFWGSNPMDMNEFKGEVEFSFGAEHEKHVINSPTIVTAAPGVYHCPLNYTKIDNPFYCMEAFMTLKYSGVDLGEDLAEFRMPEPSYDRYFTKGVVRDNKWGGESISLNQVPAHIVPAGAKMSLVLTSVRKPYMFHDTTHKHNFTEFFIFFGSNPMDMNEFDAEVEFSFGEEREKHIITSPSIITVPPGVYHCPLNYAKIDKPFYCLEAFLTSGYTSTNLPATPA